ncbi:hypothetical protein EUX98_g1798 [Antrodiella citrinella]|uniref:RRM Nup35-type domain-containing protein n=1 Tax=Antrodiella citrinella TaxID=2447956 RepID=A0A4S4N0I6_9APHY|nr:hypothetical protein EUX98_g1798 [Antrodiella citrinella]
MYSNAQQFSNSQNGYQQDQTRPPFGHSQSSFTQGQPFNVASMSSPGASHSSPGMRTSTLGSGGSLNMNDSINQSRSPYQAGYLMSANQNNTPSQSNPRYDDTPLVQPKAKMNTTMSGSTASDFGMNSMFESTRDRQRQPMDEDAPPTSSVNDIVNEVFPESASRRRLQASAFDSPARSLFRPHQSPAAPSTPQNAPSPPVASSKPLQVIVFGYPPDKYTVAVEYFRAIGESTEPDGNTEVVNCFRVGYAKPGDALKAVRRNGEVVGGSWMVGVKWADQALAESILGSLIHGTGFVSSPEPASASPDVTMSSSPSPPNHGTFSSEVALRSGTPGTPSVGTPVRLAPSASAFRKINATGSGTKAAQKIVPGGNGAFVQAGAPFTLPSQMNASPSKGIVGQVSDLIFGW